MTRNAETGKILKREDVLNSECSRNYTMQQAQRVADAENRLLTVKKINQQGVTHG